MFEYELPPDRIAQRPVGFGADRKNSKLLHCFFGEHTRIWDRHFADLTHLLGDEDVLVVNDSKVIPARFFAKTPLDYEVEILFISKGEGDLWRALARPRKKLKRGMILNFPSGERAEVVEFHGREIRLILNTEGLPTSGTMPIPPYIRGGRSDEGDLDSYQTVYARMPGSIAAPTAGLHMTEDLIKELLKAEVGIFNVTLHVGLMSILPLELTKEKSVLLTPGSESYAIPARTLKNLRKARREKKQIIALGTTTARALESFFSLSEREQNKNVGKMLETNLYIAPGYEFKIVDALITNFHQPRTTHLQLLSALIREPSLRAVYQHALNSNYRFLSYGDSCFFSPKNLSLA